MPPQPFVQAVQCAVRLVRAVREREAVAPWDGRAWPSQKCGPTRSAGPVWAGKDAEELGDAPFGDGPVRSGDGPVAARGWSGDGPVMVLKWFMDGPVRSGNRPGLVREPSRNGPVMVCGRSNYGPVMVW